MPIGAITGTGVLNKQTETRKLFLVRGHCDFRYTTGGYITVDIYLYVMATSSDEINTSTKIRDYIWNHGSYFRVSGNVRRRIPCFGGGRTANANGEYMKAEYISVLSSTSTPEVVGVSTAASPEVPNPAGSFSIDRVDEV